MNEPIPFLDLTLHNRALKESLMDAFSQCVDQASFVGGPLVEKFENEFARYCETDFCIGTSCGSSALFLILKASGVGAGDLVFLPVNTFIATSEAVSLCGATPIFVDVDLETSLLDVKRVEEAIENTRGMGTPKAIIAVHLYGQICEMELLAEVAQNHHLLLLEDAAQAHGATRFSKKAGAQSSAAAFSFYPGKNLGACGEAGAVCTNDSELASKIRMLREHGQDRKYHHALEGFNFRLHSIQAAFLSIKLAYLDEWTRNRNTISDTYDQAFLKNEKIRPIRILENNYSARHLYVVHVEQRDRIMKALGEMKIFCGMHYPEPLSWQPCYEKFQLEPGTFPCAERNCNELLSLPLFPELSQEQTSRVIQALESVL